jgi:hypothetical protein
MIFVMESRRRVCLWPLGMLVACASLDPGAITLTQAELQTLIERQFPRRQRLAEVFDVTLAAPVLRLVAERNRIATDFELSASERLSGTVLRGALAIEHALRYEPSDATLRLSQVKVERLRLDVAGTRVPDALSRLGASIAERLLDDAVIHRLSDAQREKLARAGVSPAAIAVTERGVELRFMPALRGLPPMPSG